MGHGILYAIRPQKVVAVLFVISIMDACLTVYVWGFQGKGEPQGLLLLASEIIPLFTDLPCKGVGLHHGSQPVDCGWEEEALLGGLADQHLSCGTLCFLIHLGHLV